VKPVGDSCSIIIGIVIKFDSYKLSVAVYGRFVSEFAHFIHNPTLILEIIVFTARYNIKKTKSLLTPCIYALHIPRTTNSEFFAVQHKEFKHSGGDRL